MIGDDDWQEAELLRGVGSVEPVVAISYFDTLVELRAEVAESYEELQERSGVVVDVGLRVDIDAALECCFCFYPIAAGRELAPPAGVETAALFQLGDDGRGVVDPGQLEWLVEGLLDDLYPLIACDNRDELRERFAGGERLLVLCDPSGVLLSLPGGEDDDRLC